MSPLIKSMLQKKKFKFAASEPNTQTVRENT